MTALELAEANEYVSADEVDRLRRGYRDAPREQRAQYAALARTTQNDLLIESGMTSAEVAERRRRRAAFAAIKVPVTDDEIETAIKADVARLTSQRAELARQREVSRASYVDSTRCPCCREAGAESGDHPVAYRLGDRLVKLCSRCYVAAVLVVAESDPARCERVASYLANGGANPPSDNPLADTVH
jgi:hypothetical protein